MEINEIRTQIDDVDQKMLELFLRRMELSELVAEYKQALGLPILNRQREREILSRVCERAGDKEEYAYYMFSRLFDLSKARQKELISAPTQVSGIIAAALANPAESFPKTGLVACQGTEGSNAQAACDKLLPRGQIIYVKNFRAVFDAVGSGLCKYGVVPLENSTNGSVRAVYELLREKKFAIVRSVNMNIRHELLAVPGAELKDVREIYSHQQAIGQCSRFLAALDGVRLIPCENTAVAAKMAAEANDKGIAAIASPQCEALYGLKPLADDIQDNDNNYTRFVCIEKEPVIYPGSNRISLMFSCDNKPGALGDILSKLAVHGVNMSKLESYPVSGRNFEYMFFMELDAGVQEPGIIPMLEDLERSCLSFDFLGSYSAV